MASLGSRFYTSELAKRYSALKNAEALFKKARGPNTEFGRAANWSDTPRAGARWTAAEDAELLMHFRDLISEDGTRRMSNTELCELAWHHGRSANSIESRLVQIMGPFAYLNHMQLH